MTMRRFTVAQLVLITALSCAAAYSFFMSFAYGHVDDAVADISGSHEARVILVVVTIGIGTACVFAGNWLLGAIWLAVLLSLANVVPPSVGLGAFSILLGVLLVIRRGWVWVFLGLLVALHFPSLMAFSSADWLWFVPDFAWETDLTFTPMAALSAFLVVGCLGLRYATQFRQSGMELISQGYEIADVKKWYLNKLGFASIVLLLAASIAGLITGVSDGLERLVGGHVGDVSFKAVLFGIGGSAVLIAAVYYMMVGRKTA